MSRTGKELTLLHPEDFSAKKTENGELNTATMASEENIRTFITFW